MTKARTPPDFAITRVDHGGERAWLDGAPLLSGCPKARSATALF